MSGNRIVWLNAGDAPDSFPPIDRALIEPDGLLAAGGDLSSERVLAAYCRGIFPWYEEGQPILWWSPDPRCVLFPGDFHVARRLKREIRKSSADITVNQSFEDVVLACAAPRPSQQGTWITDEMMTAFSRLHREGWAHSLEIRDRGELVAGIYGLAVGRVFFGESMFTRATNASKYAFCALARVLRDAGFALIDCQVVSGHLLTLGATTIPRTEFASILESSSEPRTRFTGWPECPVSVREFLLE